MPGYSKIVAQTFGGPEGLQLAHFADLPEPGEGEARVRVEAAGVGYTDTILRRGRYIYYTGGLPVTPGYDVVGIVDKLGKDATGVQLGDRVADMPVHGAYSQFIIRPAAGLIPVPPGVTPAAAVEVPLMWVTAWQMLTRAVSLPRGTPILVVGAGGAVGRALVKLGRHLGLQVIGTSSAGNLALVEGLGATAIDYRRQDLLNAIRAAGDGKGVAAAFDAIGGESWAVSWSALRHGGTLVAYGLQDFIESGAPAAAAATAMGQLQQWNADGIADGTDRATLFYDINLRRGSHAEEYRGDAEHLLKLIAARQVVPSPAEILPLAQAAAAHRRIAKGGLQKRLVLQP